MVVVHIHQHLPVRLWMNKEPIARLINVTHIFVVRDNLLQFWTKLHETQ